MSKAHCILDLDDVRKAGSVSAAIEQWAKDSSDTDSGVIGSSFVTSSPGSGWSQNFGASDYALRAFEGGALYYLDSYDGRLQSAESAEEGEEFAQQDIGGCWYTVGDWTDHSEVELVCPSEEDALQYPDTVAEMAQAVIDHHSHYSNRKEWATLIRLIQEAAKAVEDIDADELEG